MEINHLPERNESQEFNSSQRDLYSYQAHQANKHPEFNKKNDLLNRRKGHRHINSNSQSLSGLISKAAIIGTVAVGGVITTGALLQDVIKDYDVGDDYITFELDLNGLDSPAFEIHLEDSETGSPIEDTFRLFFQEPVRDEENTYQDSYFGLEPNHKYCLIIDKVYYEYSEGETGPSSEEKINKNLKRFPFKTTDNRPKIEIRSLNVSEYYSHETMVLAEVVYSDYKSQIINAYLHYELTDFAGNLVEYSGTTPEANKIPLTEKGLTTISIPIYVNQNVIITCYASYEYDGDTIFSEKVSREVYVQPSVYGFYQENEGIFIEVFQNINNIEFELTVYTADYATIIKQVNLASYLQEENSNQEVQYYLVDDLDVVSGQSYVYNITANDILYFSGEFTVLEASGITIQAIALDEAYQNEHRFLIDVLKYDPDQSITNAYLCYKVTNTLGEPIDNQYSWNYEGEREILEEGYQTIPLTILLAQDIILEAYVSYQVNGEYVTSETQRLTFSMGAVVNASYNSARGLEIEVLENINNDDLFIDFMTLSGSIIQTINLNSYLRSNPDSTALAYYLVDDLSVQDGTEYTYRIYHRHTVYRGSFIFHLHPTLEITDVSLENVTNEDALIYVKIRYLDNYELITNPYLRYEGVDFNGNPVDLALPGATPEILLTEKGIQTIPVTVRVNEDMRVYFYLTYDYSGVASETSKLGVEVQEIATVTSSYEPFKGISISVLENPHNDNIQYEIEDEFGNIIRSGNISSYLRQDDQTGKHYLIDDLNFVPGDRYYYRLFDRFTYLEDSFVFSKRPTLEVSSVTVNEYDNSITSLSVNVNYLDEHNFASDVYLKYYATDMSLNPIDVNLPGEMSEVAILEQGLQAIPLSLLISQKTKLYCYLEYVLNGETYTTVLVITNVNPAPSIETRFEVNDGLIIEAFENPNQDNLNIEIKNELGNVVKNTNLAGYLNTTYPSNAEEVYVLGDLALTSGKVYQIRIYSTYTLYQSEFTYYPKPKLEITSFVLEGHTTSESYVVAKANYQDPSMQVTNATLKFNATDLDHNPVDIAIPGSSMEYQLTLGNNTIPFNFSNNQAIIVSCYISYELNGTVITTTPVSLTVNPAPSIESMFDVNKGLIIEVMDNPSQNNFSIEIKDDLDAVVKEGSLTPYLDNTYPSNAEEVYVLDDLALTSGKLYSFRVYDDFVYHIGEFTYYPKPTLGVTSIVITKHTIDNTFVNVTTNYVDASTQVTNANLKFNTTDLVNNPVEVTLPGAATEFPLVGGIEENTIGFYITNPTILSCYITYDLGGITYTSQAVTKTIYPFPTIESGFDINQGLLVHVFNHLGSDELSLEIKDDLNVIVRDGSLTPYLENSSNNEEHYLVNDLALEFGKEYQYRIYGDFTYYESSFTYYPKPNLGVLAAVPREVMYGHVVDFVVTVNYQDPDGVVMNPSLHYIATDTDYNLIDVATPGDPTQFTFDQGVQEVYMSLNITQNAILTYFITYELDGINFQTEDFVINVNLPPVVDGSFNPNTKNLDVTVTENPNQEELFYEILDMNFNVLRSGSLDPYSIPPVAGGMETYEINDLSELNLVIGDTYMFRVYGTYRFFNSEFVYE